MEKIRRVSLYFRIIFQVLFFALPILLIVSWVYAPEALVMLHGIIHLDAIPRNYNGMHVFAVQDVPEKAILHALSVTEKTLGCLVSSIPVMVNMFILFMLIKLFRLYEQGEIFTVNNVKYIRNIGYALLLGQLIDPIYQFIMGIVLTMHNPPHHRFASITLDQTNIGIIFTALLVILISWIMLEGYKLREEQQLTV